MSEPRNGPPSHNPVIPDKLYFRIGEVARLLAVETHTLRFWETEFPQLKVGKGGTGQRLYRRRDVELVFEIKHLLYNEGYTIPGARQFLQNRQRRKNPEMPDVPVPQRRPKTEGAAEPGIERIRAGLRDLSAMLTNSESQNRALIDRSVRERSNSAKPQSRRGLHLAARPAEKEGVPRPATDHPATPALRGLFDTPSD